MSPFQKTHSSNNENKIKKIVHKNARELYGKRLNIYYNVYNNISDEERERMDEKYNPKSLLIKSQRPRRRKK